MLHTVPKIKRKSVDILNRRNKGEKVVFGIVFVLLAVYAVSILYPILWIFLSSLKEPLEYAVDMVSLPKKWLFSNYIRAFDSLSLQGGITFYNMIWNSVWYTTLASGLSAFMASVTGYCLSKYNFKLKGFIYGTAIFCMTVPIVGTMAANYRLVTQLKIIDTPLYVVVTHMSSWGSYFLIMYGFFKNISWNYAEAVLIDGGSHFTVFFRIMLPQARGPLFTLFLMAAIGNWNDYMTIILYLPSYQTLSSGLYTYRAVMERSVEYPLYFAGLIISIIPIVTLFAAFSNVIMTNMSVGGLKG